MQVWIVTNGIYDDETVIAVATSQEEADAITARARLDFVEFEADFHVSGPFELGVLYSRMGDKL